ncbi:hypothetical protein SMJ63A_40245 [Stenotrophomonas geniculata]
MGLSLSFREKKVTKETLRHPRAGAARRCPVLLGESGDGAELAALKQRRLFAPDSPAVLGSLQGGLNSRERTHDRSCRPEPSVGSALHRTHPQAPPDTRKALLYTANSNPTKNPAEAGFFA